MHKKHHPRPVVPVHKALGPNAATAKQQHGQAQLKQQHKQQPKQQQKQQQANKGQPNASPGPAHKKQKVQHGNQHAAGANGFTKQHQQQQRPQAIGNQQHQKSSQQPSTQQQQQQQPKQPSQLNDAKQQQRPKQQLGKHAGTHQQQQQQQQQKLPTPGQQQQQTSTGSKKRKRKAPTDASGKGGPAAGAAAECQPSTAAPAAAAAAPAAAAAAAKPWHPGSATVISSNWQALQQQLKAAKAAAAASGQHTSFRRKRKDTDDTQDGSSSKGGKEKAAKRHIGSVGRNTALTHVVAMDCEMVGVGPNGDRDSLARVSVVNAAGNVLLDTFVAQKEAVTDFRTWVSGVTPQHLVGAPSIEEVQKQVSELLSGRVVVGHSINKDLKVLLLSHPRKDIRDTAKYPPFMFSKGGKRRPKALKQLAQQELGLTIQEGQHSSVDDARAALYLYQKHTAEWERALKTPGAFKQLPTSNQVARKKRIESYGAKSVTDDPMADL